MKNSRNGKNIDLGAFSTRRYLGSIDADTQLIVIRISEGGIALYDVIVEVSNLGNILVEGKVQNLIQNGESTQFTQEIIAIASVEGDRE